MYKSAKLFLTDRQKKLNSILQWWCFALETNWKCLLRYVMRHSFWLTAVSHVMHMQQWT